jgi:hypothetical protein
MLKMKLQRECPICLVNIHQDLLHSHCNDHYKESSVCGKCSRVSTNAANFVTHVLSHLEAQFNCIKCDKWFRQSAVYFRHIDQCQSNDQNLNQLEIDKKERINGRHRRNSSTTTETSIKNEPVSLEKKVGRRGRPPKLSPPTKPTVKKEKIRIETTIRTRRQRMNEYDELSTKNDESTSYYSENQFEENSKMNDEDEDGSMIEDDDGNDDEEEEEEASIDDLDDIIVSDYEYDDDDNDNEESRSRSRSQSQIPLEPIKTDKNEKDDSSIQNEIIKRKTPNLTGTYKVNLIIIRINKNNLKKNVP